MDKSFVIYETHYSTIMKLDEEEQFKMLKCLIEYGLYEQEPELDGMNELIFGLMKPGIDSAKKRYKTSVENGKKGGRPKTQTKPNNNLKKPNHNPNDNVNDNVNDNEHYSVNGKNGVSSLDTTPSSKTINKKIEF